MRQGLLILPRVVVHESMHGRVGPFKRFMFYTTTFRFASFVL